MDKYTVMLLPRAYREIDEIFGYIANDLTEPETALKMVDTIEAAILSLEQMPHRCAVRSHGIYASKGYRQLFVKNYAVIFRIDEENHRVVIVTVRYSGSDF